MRSELAVVLTLAVGASACGPNAGAPTVAPGRRPPTHAGSAPTMRDAAPSSGGCFDGPPRPKPAPREPLTRTTQSHDRTHGAVTCRGGEAVWLDAAKRMRACTTAKAVTVFGVSIPAGAYSHFHPDGRLAQAKLASPHTLYTRAGLAVACTAGHTMLSSEGALLRCELSRAMTIGDVVLRGGHGIAFHGDGALAGGTLDRPHEASVGTIPAGTSVSWRADGSLSRGWLKDPVTVGGLPIRSEFLVYPNGRLESFTLAEDHAVQGHDFGALTEIRLRPDGSLSAAAIVDYDTMPHGELITLTTHLHYDCGGLVVSEVVDRDVDESGPEPP